MSAHALTFRRPVTADLFRDVLGSVCTPVTVVTTSHGGAVHASTVSAFSSLSVDPPLVLVALDRTSQLLRLIILARVFAVNVLALDQDGTARALARKRADKLYGTGWFEHEGLPRLPGVSAWIACRVYRLVVGGDHMIVMGLVVGAERGAAPPLLYRQRGFTTTRRPRDSHTHRPPDTDHRPGAALGEGSA